MEKQVLGSRVRGLGVELTILGKRLVLNVAEWLTKEDQSLGIALSYLPENVANLVRNQIVLHMKYLKC